jgi:hypothetical protein
VKWIALPDAKNGAACDVVDLQNVSLWPPSYGMDTKIRSAPDNNQIVVLISHGFAYPEQFVKALAAATYPIHRRRL